MYCDGNGLWFTSMGLATLAIQFICQNVILFCQLSLQYEDIQLKEPINIPSAKFFGMLMTPSFFFVAVIYFLTKHEHGAVDGSSLIISWLLSIWSFVFSVYMIKMQRTLYKNK